MTLNLDLWPVKIVIVLALIGLREAVRLLSPRPPTGRKNEWVETIDSGALAIGLVLLVIQPFILQAFRIPTGSMENTMPPGDRLVASKLIYHLREPQFQDIIIFKAPLKAVSAEEAVRGEDVFIKRCIGLPGDVVWAANRVYHRRAAGQSTLRTLSEPYVKWSDDARLSYSYEMKIVDGEVYAHEQPERDAAAFDLRSVWTKNGVPLSGDEQRRIESAAPGAVPPGRYLMLGDHRNNSRDGHVWGFIDRSAILGKAIWVFWPPSNAGLADRLSFPVR